MSQNNRLNEEKTAIDKICFLPVRKIQKLCERLKNELFTRTLVPMVEYSTFYSPDSL